MSCFADTSALYALLDAADANHSAAAREWASLLDKDEVLVVTNYVQVETLALVQRRLGMAAIRAFQSDIVPILTVKWVDDQTHAAGVSAMLSVQRRDLSLVDCVSFEVMRKLGIREVFTFDSHFAEQGFRIIPMPGKRISGVAESSAGYRYKERQVRRRRRASV